MSSRSQSSRTRASSDFERILFIPDTHAPYHDKRAFKLAVAIAKKLKPSYVVILGDFADFYSVSSHDRSPDRKTSLVKEVEVVKSCLNQLYDSCRAKRYVYVSGNHEYRLARYIRTKAPDLFGVTDVPSILELEESGWEYVPYHDYLKLGKLIITHDTGSAGMNAHRKSLGDAGGDNSIVIGHTHRMALDARRTTEGKFISAAMFGWLGDPKQIDWLHRAKLRHWVQGVGVGYMLKDRTVLLQPVPFSNYSCIVEGELFRG